MLFIYLVNMEGYTMYTHAQVEHVAPKMDIVELLVSFLLNT